MTGWSAYRKLGETLSTKCSVLDYGCGSGEYLQLVGGRIGSGVGVDLDARLIEAANRTNRHAAVRYIHADASAALPFEPASFDLIVALGVLEHVGVEAPYIREFHRLLRPGGHLVIDVPSMGPFRVFDIGNIKYNFPKLHRMFYYYVARQREYYDRNFGPDAPMFGQFSRDATQHKHYSAHDVDLMVRGHFSNERYIHYGLFFELIQFAEVVACKPFGKSTGALFSWLMKLDCKLLSPLGRANYMGLFRREEGPSLSLPNLPIR